MEFLAVRSQITSDGIQCHNGCNSCVTYKL